MKETRPRLFFIKENLKKLRLGWGEGLKRKKCVFVFGFLSESWIRIQSAVYSLHAKINRIRREMIKLKYNQIIIKAQTLIGAN